jgi:hypothetical protein
MARLTPNVGTKNTLGKCDPTNPGPNNVSIQIIVSAIGRRITVTTIDTACSQSFSRTYVVTAQDNEIYDLPDDLHQTTLEMLDGIARRFMRFSQHGFDREP